MATRKFLRRIAKGYLDKSFLASKECCMTSLLARRDKHWASGVSNTVLSELSISGFAPLWRVVQPLTMLSALRHGIGEKLHGRVANLQIILHLRDSKAILPNQCCFDGPARSVCSLLIMAQLWLCSVICMVETGKQGKTENVLCSCADALASQFTDSSITAYSNVWLRKAIPCDFETEKTY